MWNPRLLTIERMDRFMVTNRLTQFGVKTAIVALIAFLALDITVTVANVNERPSLTTSQ